MRLSDIMSQMHLAHYAEVALVLFLIVFLAVCIHVFRKKNADRWEQAKHMPLDDENPQSPRSTPS